MIPSLNDKPANKWRLFEFVGDFLSKLIDKDCEFFAIGNQSPFDDRTTASICLLIDLSTLIAFMSYVVCDESDFTL